MADLTLKIENRANSGKADARRLRRTGKIPAVIYGEDQETIPLLLDAHEFELMLGKHHTIVDLDLEGKKIKSIVRDIQRHPVTGDVLHVDFFTVTSGHKMTLSISINFVGTAAGAKVGGIFQTVKNELNISVLPKDILDYVEVDVSKMEIGDNIRIKDLGDKDFEILDDPEEVICRVQAQKAVEEEEEGEELEEEESAEPEVITAREKEEDESE